MRSDPTRKDALILTATGYITSFRVAEGRKPAQTDAERAQLLRTMAAWTGRYRVEGTSYLSGLMRRGTRTIPARSTCGPLCSMATDLTITTVTPSRPFFPADRPPATNSL